MPRDNDVETSVERVDPLVGTIFDQRFRVEERIAAGGFGAIYRATHVKSGHQIALKVLLPSIARDLGVVARFRREGDTLTALRNPHTINAYELGQAADRTLFIVMELLYGESLFERYKANGPFEWKRMVRIARQVCESLAEAHARGVVHRDLKPTNIHLEQHDGDPDYVKVLDFGIAKILRGGDFDAADITNAGQMIGTIDYMSPEQMVGGNVTGQSDIYTLGIVMYEMIAGTTPFPEAMTAAQALAAMMKTKPDALYLRAPVPEELDRIVMRCLERDLAKRYQTVIELAADLDRLLAGAGDRARSIQTKPIEKLDEESTTFTPPPAQLVAESRRARRASAEQTTFTPPPAQLVADSRRDPWAGDEQTAFTPPPEKLLAESRRAKRESVEQTMFTPPPEQLLASARRAPSEWDDEDEFAPTSARRPEGAPPPRSAPSRGAPAPDDHDRVTKVANLADLARGAAMTRPEAGQGERAATVPRDAERGATVPRDAERATARDAERASTMPRDAERAATLSRAGGERANTVPLPRELAARNMPLPREVADRATTKPAARGPLDSGVEAKTPPYSLEDSGGGPLRPPYSREDSGVEPLRPRPPYSREDSGVEPLRPTPPYSREDSGVEPLRPTPPYSLDESGIGPVAPPSYALEDSGVEAITPPPYSLEDSGVGPITPPRYSVDDSGITPPPYSLEESDVRALTPPFSRTDDSIARTPSYPRSEDSGLGATTPAFERDDPSDEGLTKPIPRGALPASMQPPPRRADAGVAPSRAPEPNSVARHNAPTAPPSSTAAGRPASNPAPAARPGSRTAPPPTVLVPPRDVAGSRAEASGGMRPERTAGNPEREVAGVIPTPAPRPLPRAETPVPNLVVAPFSQQTAAPPALITPVPAAQPSRSAYVPMPMPPAGAPQPYVTPVPGMPPQPGLAPQPLPPGVPMQPPFYQTPPGGTQLPPPRPAGFDVSKLASRDAAIRRMVWIIVLVAAGIVGIVLATKL